MWDLSDSMKAIALLAMLALAGWSVSQPPTTKPPVAESGRVEPEIVFQLSYDSFGQRSSGVILAGWSDGLVVFAIAPDRPGAAMQVGRIATEQLSQVLDDLTSAGFFEEHKRRGLAPDESTTRMSASHDGKSADYRWSEALSRPHGAHVGADVDFKRFAKMWTLSRTALAFAYPTEYQPLEKDEVARKRFNAAVGSRDLQTYIPGR